MLGKNMVKFCSGDFNPDSVPVETKYLDPLLSTASKSPPDQIEAKGLDGKFPSELISCDACISVRPGTQGVLLLGHGND